MVRKGWIIRGAAESPGIPFLRAFLLEKGILEGKTSALGQERPHLMKEANCVEPRQASDHAL